MREKAGQQVMHRGPGNACGPFSGVSEVMGSFLLISIVVLAVAIVAVLLFSQTTPQQVPNVNFMVGTDSSTPPTLYLYHNGGDSLNAGEFSVLVDGVSDAYQVGGGGTVWSLGKSLVIHLPAGTVPKSVVIVYNKTGSGSVVLRSASVNISTIPANIGSDIFASPTYPPVVDVTQLTQNVTNQSINFYREGGTKIQSGFLKFNVTRINSTMVTNNSVYPLISLNVGNVVTIVPDSNAQGIRIFGIGDQIWELTSDVSVLTVSNRSGSDIGPVPVMINHTWITGYKDLQSTLSLQGSGGPYETELAVNQYPSYVNELQFSSRVINGSSLKTVTISSAGPLSTGLFVLQLDNKTKSMYFVGNATSISIV
ncbi:MAG TPA: type IV pilin N-terminal domain-containing protein [Methanoregula sp.]|nr:type IV pilin N-terminal domain-containing protein [Methanoregula sp.]